ncbi:spore coat protein B [Bacillus mycoides]|nr:spore coat protein B [Bacillus mycoides]MED1382705.1 spore coat protein B [Bacillus mycoides]PFX98760.1 spore coat protein B [Bacillus mycoides]QWH76302.1 spore coat protein B [Bacillus mycoides]QWI46583.1 spore coat protein B [Bacillus mycoides]
MNMKKAIIVIASTAIALYTIKNRKKKQNENENENALYYPYTLLKKK